MMKHLVGLALVASLFARAGYADVVSPTKANGDFIAGTGIPGNSFTVDTAGTGESVALQARGRDPGNPPVKNVNTYLVQGGYATNGTSPWWNFDYQFSPGLTGGAQSEYELTLKVDFDPGVGTTNFVTLTMPVAGNGSLINNPGTWSNATPYAVADSLNLGFAFWGTLGAPPFDPNVPGEYEIDLSATRNGLPLNATSILVNVAPVPEPSSMALAGLAIPALAGWRRWRRRKA
jgi:PEP-CTERM motif